MDTNEKVSITFDETRVVDDSRKGTSAEERYEEGKTYELTARSADRWVKRGVAHFTTDEDAAKASGASSDVSLKLQDRDRIDPQASRTPAVGTGTGTAVSDEAAGAYAGLKGPELKEQIKTRGLDLGGATKNAEFIAILQRDDKIKAALESKDFSGLTVEELQELAAKENIDLTGKTEQSDIAAAVAEHFKPAA